jgi:O-antigen/teichoic acid export membrane protein
LGIVIRQSAKSTIVQYIGIVIGYVNIVLLFPRCLPLDQIGLVRFIQEMALFLAFFAQLGFPQAINRFYPYFKNEEKNDHGFQFFVFVFPLAGILLFSGIFILFKPLFEQSFVENSPLVIEYYWYFVPFIFAFVYLNVTEVFCSTQMRIVVPRIIREIFLRGVTSVLLLAKCFDYITFDEMMYGLIASHFAGVIINFIYIHQLKGLSLKPDFSLLKDKKFRNQMLRFIVFIVIAGIGSTIVNKIDSYMISSWINLSSFTIYSTALFIATVIEMPYRSISQISSPIIANSLRNNDMARVEDIYKKSSINQTILGIIIFLLIWINVDNLFSIMPKGDEFRAGKYVLFFIGLSKVFDLMTGVNTSIIVNSKFYSYIFYFTLLLAALTIGLNYFLIPEYGIIGVAIAMAVSIFIYNVILFFLVKIKFGLIPFTYKTLLALVLGGLLYAINELLPVLTNPYMDSFLRTAVIASLFTLMIYKLKLSAEINQALLQVLKRMKLRG